MKLEQRRFFFIFYFFYFIFPFPFFCFLETAALIGRLGISLVELLYVACIAYSVCIFETVYLFSVRKRSAGIQSG